MHSSVLQNDKYIEFANENTVEVIALSRLQEGVDKKDPKAEQYDAKDENGNPVKYMKEFPGLTLADMLALDGSPAGQYNKTGRIPYTAIVDPHSLAEIRALPGGQSAKGLSEAITEAKAKLNKERGPSLKRSSLEKVRVGVRDVEGVLQKAGVAKAFEAYRKLEQSLAKEPDPIKAKAKEVEAKLLDAAKTQLDDAEAKIVAGDAKGAKTLLTPLAKALKGTDLEARAAELLERTKPAEPAK
jgi:hypothetical protein